MFADPESKLSKYGPKSWRSSHTHGLDANGRPLLEMHFRVHFYLENPLLLKDDTSRSNYYLQIKYNVFQRDIPKELTEKSYILLSSLALQTDLGDAPSSTVTKTFKTCEDAKKNKISKRDQCLHTKSFAASKVEVTAMRDANRSADKIVNKLKKHKNESNFNLADEIEVLDKDSCSTRTMRSSNFSNMEMQSSELETNLDYFRMEDYLPQSLRNAAAAEALKNCHKEVAGMSRIEAQFCFIEQACALHDNINAHIFRMRLSKTENIPGNSWFVVYAKGIKVIKASNNQLQQLTFMWHNISKLSFERKKFEIRSGDTKIVLYASSDEKNKMLLTLCKDTHQFSMKIATRIKQIDRKEEEDSNCSHNSGISNNLVLPVYKNKNDQRISVISSTSSNTTSGIISDRVQSEDELEIMINMPPASLAAPSTESLALAHLLDKPSVSRQTSSVANDIKSQLVVLSKSHTIKQLSKRSLSDLSTKLYNLSTENSLKNENSSSSHSHYIIDSSFSTIDSPNSQQKISSQCSSTCSTVVVTTMTESSKLVTVVRRSSIGSNKLQRKNSTSSSLELGFSHTAQNSTASAAGSACLQHDSPLLTNDINENVAGMYATFQSEPPTETSGIYTMHSSEMTGQSVIAPESEKSSFYDSVKAMHEAVEEGNALSNTIAMDLIDGANNIISRKRNKIDEFRMRSGSDISNSASFRGDGSDQCNNKHTNLLSADELSDLIVGRGTYPARKTVSRSLDTDSDYVTLQTPQNYSRAVNSAHKQLDVNSFFSNYLQNSKDNNDKKVNRSNKNSAEHFINTNLMQHANLQIPSSLSNATIQRRSPPPYPSVLKQRPVSLISDTSSSIYCNRRVDNKQVSTSISGSLTSLKSEEVTARFITTRPQINILKAHTSLVRDNPLPSYAAPTQMHSVSSKSRSIYSSHPRLNSTPPQHHIVQNYHCGSHTLIAPKSNQFENPSKQVLSMHNAAMTSAMANTNTKMASKRLSNAANLPHSSVQALHQQSAGKSASHACVFVPVIKPRTLIPPPPPCSSRQPPPPPPAQFTGMLTNQLSRTQVELYRQQLCSNVDYVMYPIQDPAVSFQEYLDAKESSNIAASGQNRTILTGYFDQQDLVTAWESYKGQSLYRSTPYIPLSLNTKNMPYCYSQNYSDTYLSLASTYSPFYLPSSPSMISLCSSMEPPPPLPLHTISLSAGNHFDNFSRSRSDDNILNSLDLKANIKRAPPPPPPYIDRRLKKNLIHMKNEQPPPIPSKSNLKASLLANKSIRTKVVAKCSKVNKSWTSSNHYKSQKDQLYIAQRRTQIEKTDRTTSVDTIDKMPMSELNVTPMSPCATATPTANALDIALLREKSKNLDLPLISALCNDRSLLKQTKVLRNSKKHQNSHSNAKREDNSFKTIPSDKINSPTMATSAPIAIQNVYTHQHPSTLTETSISNVTMSLSDTSFSQKASVSTGPIDKSRKIPIMHRHPKDKLPPLPIQTAEANNYVIDPAILKQKKNYK